MKKLILILSASTLLATSAFAQPNTKMLSNSQRKVMNEISLMCMKKDLNTVTCLKLKQSALNTTAQCGTCTDNHHKGWKLRDPNGGILCVPCA